MGNFMPDAINICATQSVIGEEMETLFYDAGSISRAKLLDRLNMIFREEILSDRKSAISKPVDMLS